MTVYIKPGYTLLTDREDYHFSDALINGDDLRCQPLLSSTSDVMEVEVITGAKF